MLFITSWNVRPMRKEPDSGIGQFCGKERWMDYKVKKKKFKAWWFLSKIRAEIGV